MLFRVLPRFFFSRFFPSYYIFFLQHLSQSQQVYTFPGPLETTHGHVINGNLVKPFRGLSSWQQVGIKFS